MKAKLKGAETGHSLLKRKSEALTKCVYSFAIDFELELTFSVLDQAFSRYDILAPILRTPPHPANANSSG